jgi:hypothetical protein
MRAAAEALMLKLFGLDPRDVSDLLADCDYSVERLDSKGFTRELNPKGFWRQERGLEPQYRLSVLTQIAFEELHRLGESQFLDLNDGEGWQLPETLRMADYGLGHDHRANEHQFVASVLGPRFYPWQLEQSVEESWEECERHAEILDKLLPRRDVEPEFETENWVAPTVDLFGDPLPTDLFGNLITKSSRR